MVARPIEKHPNNPIDAWHQSQDCPHILLVISSPLDEPARLNPVREVEEIFRQLGFAKVPAALIKLNPPTFQYLRATLLSCRFDVVHFIGHATTEAIQLEKDDGTADWVSAHDLASLFEEAKVKLVVLNNCSSETLADSLITQRVPAVIATSNRIHADDALLLSNNLYSVIFKGHSPKYAVEAINQSIRREKRVRFPATIIAAGPKANEPITSMSPAFGDPEFYRCNPVNNLPPLSRDVFYDRVHECLKIYDGLTSLTSPFIGVTGLPGSGKSAVALSCAWRYGWRFSKGIGYVSLRQKPFTLSAFLRHLNWAIDTVPTDRLLSTITYELSQGQYLLIFDDVESATSEEINSIVELLQSWDTSLGGRAILIMRQRRPELDHLVQANWIPIGDLPNDAAIELFQFHVGGEEVAKNKVGNDLSKIPELCFRHPKLLQATASALVSGAPWSEVVTNLKHLIGDPAQRSIEMLERTIEQIQAEVPLVTHFLNSWSAFGEYATESAWRFIVQGEHLSPEDPMWLLQTDALHKMQRVNILERYSVGNETQCKIHPLMSEYLRIRRWQGLTQEKRKNYELLHLKYYIQSISSAEGDEYPIVNEWGNIALALERAKQANNWSAILSLCVAIVGSDDQQLVKKGPWEYARTAIEFGLEAAEQLKDLRNRAVFLKHLGIICYRLSEYSQSKDAYEEALLIAKSSGYFELAVDALKGAGQVYYRTGKYDAAEEKYKTGLEIAETEGDQKCIADIQHQLGKIAYRQTRMNLAHELFETVLETRRIINDRRGMSKTLHEIGRVMHATGRYPEAEALYQESLALRIEVNDPVGQQATLHQLGLLAFDRDDCETAQRYYADSMKLSEALNDRLWIAHNLFRSGQLLRKQGNPEAAMREATKSLEMCKLLGIGLRAEVQMWLDSMN